MSKNLSMRSILAVLALLFISTMAFGQAGSGSITGVVSDQNGAVIPNATVKLVSQAKGTEQTTTASGDGIFTFVNLDPGKYTLTASGGNFAEQKLEVEVAVGRRTDANFTLGARGVGETVTVTAEGVQTTQSNSDALLSETAISNLPINGRRFQDFATLTPTAQIDTERNQISLSGQRGINANINVDGVDYNQPFFGGIRGGERSNFAPTIPQESIKEFQVVAAGYNAEFGRSTGGIVNVVTKSGSNDFRGTAFYLLRPENFSRNHELVRAIERERNIEITAGPTQHQFGGSIGGAFVQNKLFYSASYEQQRFRADRFVIFGLAGITRGPTNQEAYDYFRSLETSYELTNDARTGLGRLDWNINNQHSVNFRFSMNKGEGKNSVAVGDAGVLFNPVVDTALSMEGTEIDKNRVLVAQFSSVFSPKFINDFRFQYAKGERPRLANAQTPSVTAGGVGLYGTRSFLPTTQSDTRWQFVDGFSINTGNHNIKFGGEYSDIFQDQLFGFNQFGQYSANQTGNLALESLSITVGSTTDRRFDTTQAFYNQQIGNLQAAFTVKELAFYGQDSWRVTPSVTFNFGLRAEKQYNPEAQLGNTAIINFIRAATFPALGGGGRSFDPTIIPDSPWQWGPRGGFAWDIKGDSKSVLRGFAGIYYARTPGLILAAPLNNFRLPPGDVSVGLLFNTSALSAATAAGVTAYNAFLTANPQYVAIMTATGTPCPQVVNPADPRACVPNTVFRQFATINVNLNAFPLSGLPTLTPAQLQDMAGRLGNAIVPASGATVIAMARDYKNPKSYQFGFGYEYEIQPNWVVGVDYSHVKTTHLQRNRDINLPVPTPDANGRPIFVNRNGTKPVTTLNRIVIREDSAESLFRAVTVRTRVNRKRANINAYLTVGRSLSDDDNERNATGLFYENSFDLRSEWGLARLDRKVQFVANPLFYLPAGFEVSSTIRLRTGVPFDATIGADVNGDGNNNDRPLLVPGIPMPRNSFRNRPEYVVDFRGQKGFGFGEGRRLVLSAEIFNVFNNANIQYGGNQTLYCASADRNSACGLNGPTQATFQQLYNPATGLLITPSGGNFSRTPVFQMQFGVRLQF
jgi:outer membrane receptor protein involved in Fe transport